MVDVFFSVSWRDEEISHVKIEFDEGSLRFLHK